MDINRFTEKSREALTTAQGLAAQYGHQEVDAEHLALALVNQEDGFVPRVLERVGVAPKALVTALEAVPAEYEDASLALGATPIETYFHVSVPAAKSGIAAAVVLGVGRSIGEAMAVMMVSGNATSRMPSLFESGRFLTTAVASEMSYSSGLQQQALFSIALVLFLFIMLINAGLNLLLKRNKEG